MEVFNVKTPYNVNLDRWEMMDFCRRRDFVLLSDAWDHASRNLPKGIFVQIFDHSGMIRAWGFNGCRMQTQAILPGQEEGEEHA